MSLPMEERIAQAIRAAAETMGAADAAFRMERPKDPTHGDWASNVALALASRLRRPPRQIAEELAERLGTLDGVDRVEVAGPGFLNFRLGAGEVGDALRRILVEDGDYGRADEGRGRRIMVEFVSANPTGPLHLGHGCQAALGDAIANLLEWTGWDVHREFYFNDAGKQMDRLAESVRARCIQALGGDEPVPEGGYRGAYVSEIAQALIAEFTPGDGEGGARVPWTGGWRRSARGWRTSCGTARRARGRHPGGRRDRLRSTSCRTRFTAPPTNSSWKWSRVRGPW